MATVGNCCRCNRTGWCRNCSCRKASKNCQSCLPARLGHCLNQTATATATIALASSTTSCGDFTNQSSQSPRNSQVPVSISLSTLGNSHGDLFRGEDSEIENTIFDGQSSIPDLPAFEPMSSPAFLWGEIDSATTISTITSAYREVMQWKKHLFPVPWGNVGSAFVSELSRLYRAYAESSALECIAMKAVAIMPGLLLQKPHPKSKYKEHKACLE